jgi:hypothetical protein
MPRSKLLKLKHDRREVGFLSALVTEEDTGCLDCWSLRVESPSSTEEFRVHLTDGSSMGLTMVTREGAQLYGEAYVSSISDGLNAATVIVLAGTGPLSRR